MLSPASPSGSSPGSPPSPPPHAHLHRSRRRSAHGFLSRLPSTARQHRWLLLSLLATAAWLALSRRTVPFFVLGSTYLLSSSYPTPVLGSPPDGFDLVNLKPAPGRTEEAVPRLIHQVRLGGLAMRPAWEEARASCLALHPAGEGWEFRLWEDAEGDAFVKAEYPDLFDLYRGYEQEIMRSNVLRYLVLHKYGGVYRASGARLRSARNPAARSVARRSPAHSCLSHPCTHVCQSTSTSAAASSSTHSLLKSSSRLRPSPSASTTPLSVL